MACIPFISWPDDMTMHDYSEIRLFNWQHTCNMFFVKKIMPLMCNFIVYRVSLFDLWIKLRFRSRCFKLTRNAEKIRTFFYDIFYTKKTWNQRVLMLIISPFILDDHFLQGIIKIWVDVVNKYQRCRTKMHSCHARHCSTQGLKESPWRRDSCWST